MGGQGTGVSPAGLPAGTDLLPCLPLFPGSGKWPAVGRAAGIPPLPKPTCPGGGQPHTPGKPWGAAWPGSTSLGLPGWGLERGGGCPGRVKAFQAKIPQQKAGSASELKSKC